jgi:parvulin-like peptidyl-prolyl isomerase
MYKYHSITVLLFLLMAGCNDQKSGPTDAELDRIALTQKIELVEAAGGLALVVAGETITSDEIIGSKTELNGNSIVPKDYFKPFALANNFERFRSLTKSEFDEIVLDRITDILLVQHAKRQAGENVDEALEKAAESEFRKFVLGYGGDEVKADEELTKLGMDRESFKERQKEALLVQWYLQSELADTRPVTYRELIDGYSEMKDKYFTREARITFRLIDIQPNRLKIPDPNGSREQYATNLAGRLVERVRAGEDFAELAKKFSHGHRKAFGGLWQPVQPDSLAAPYDVLAREADKIEPGQIAGPIVVEGHVFIMKLQDKQVAGYEPFEDPDVQRLVERKVLLDRQNSAQQRLKARLRQEARLGRADEFVDFCLEKIYTLSRRPQ